MPVAYYLHSLNMAEKAFEPTHKTRLAVAQPVLVVWPSLGRFQFTLRTDHYAPRWALNTMATRGRLTHWPLRLLEIDFETFCNYSMKHQAAHAISWIPTTRSI